MGYPTPTPEPSLSHNRAATLQLSVVDLVKTRKSVSIPVRIPKGARIAAADALASTIDSALEIGDCNSWHRLLLFAPQALGRGTPRSVRSSLTRDMKENIQLFLSSSSLVEAHNPCDELRTQSSRGCNIRRAVNSKLAQGDVAAAVRLVASDDTVLEPTDEVLNALKLKHPSTPSDTRPIPPPDPDIRTSLSADDVLKALRSFKPGSSGGADGLRPGHLLDLTSSCTADAGVRLTESIVKLCDRLANGHIPPHARDLLFSANLTALRKKDGGIRPIAVGNTFRRLAAKVICQPAVRSLAPDLIPIQLGVGVPGGCEAASHAIRSVFSGDANLDPPNGNFLVKLDMRNAFNTIRRDHLLEQCHLHAPSVYNLAHLSYSEPSILAVGESSIPSESGIQQGDPLGPLLFALGVNDIARSITTPINIWYLDDATVGGTLTAVCANLRHVVPALAEIGLIVNPTKSEIINIDCDPEQFANAVTVVHEILGGVSVTQSDELKILGSPIMPPAIRSDLLQKRETLEGMTLRLQEIDSHPALFLLRNCFSIPKLLFTLRSSPCHVALDQLQGLDGVIRASASSICNTCFDDTGWQLASLPVAKGGIGLRAPSLVADPAYNASVHVCQPLVESILHNTNESPLDSVVSGIAARWTAAGLPLPDNPRRQKVWDDISVLKVTATLRNSLDQHRLACLEAASQPHSGAWLSAFPSSATGNLLSDDCMRYAVALRTGSKVCTAHRCRCGMQVDEFGLHPLSCPRSAGRFPRHTAINDVIRRALDAAGFSSILEPIGLDRGDGKRPDGMTVFPFVEGKSLVWDATCSDTFARSLANESAIEPGFSSKRAEERKVAKYSSLGDRYVFTPVAIETSGVYGPATSRFLEDLGRRIARRNNDNREISWLFQRLSVAIVRGNHLSLVASSSIFH